MKTDPSLLRVPDIAWPTVLLAAGALLVWILSGLALAMGWIPGVLGLVLSTVAAFVSFTPMHDATHRSVGRRKHVNAVVGRLAAIPLMAPFPAFRHLHLSHHRHTNDPDEDPDQWAGRGPAWQLPLRWLSQDVHYYARYLPNPSRPRAEKLESIVTLVVLWAVAVALVVSSPWGLAVVLGWILPARLAIALLSFSFDYLPHRPHTVLAKDDRYAATVNFRESWLSVVLLNQNFHLAHHLFPGVPFYRYHLVWRAKRARLEARGGRTVGLTDLGWWRDPRAEHGHAPGGLTS